MGGDEGDEITVYGIKNYDDNMNQLQLAFFNSCSTGTDKNNESLVGAMYEEGAHCIVSFTRTCIFNSSQEWYGYFNLALNKTDIDTAIIFADRMLLNSIGDFGNTNARHVLGDTSLFYNYEAFVPSDNSSTLLANATRKIQHGFELEDFEEYAYSPDSDIYYITTDNERNLYGYLNDSNDLAFYLMNRRYTNFEGDYMYMSNAMSCCVSYLNELGYSLGDFTFETSNEYSSEFIIELSKREEAKKGEIEKIVIYVEKDSSNMHHVTFFRAIRNEG